MRGFILDKFGFSPTPEQEKALGMMVEFILNAIAKVSFCSRVMRAQAKRLLLGLLFSRWML